jgi:predicted MFS family arabinose efflux permease
MNFSARLAAGWRGGPLSDRSFRLLASGQFTSTVGDYCYAVALPWLVLSAHGGTILLGTVLACYGLPRTAAIPAGGLLTDKIGPRAIMLTADATRCGLVIVLVAIADRHVATLALLGPVAALLGAGEGLFIPASFSIMPSLLEPGHLAAGNAVNSAAVQAGSVAGPVLGGLLVATAGPAPAFAVDAASFAVSALSLALIRPRPSAAAAGGPAGPADGATGQGQPRGTGTRAEEGVWSLLRRERLLQIIVVVVIAANVAFGGTFEVALPALAHARFGAGGYGALIACLGAGAVIGTLSAARAGSADRPALVASGSFLVEAMAVGLIPFLGGLPGAAAATFVLGACNGMGNVVFLTMIQRWAPPRLLGRVMSVIMLAGIGSFPLSVAVSGVLVHHLGPSPFFPVAAATVAISIFGAMSRREFRDFGSAQPPEAELGAESA